MMKLVLSEEAAERANVAENQVGKLRIQSRSSVSVSRNDSVSASYINDEYFECWHCFLA